MRKTLFTILLGVFLAGYASAQTLVDIGNNNPTGFSPDDSLVAYFADQGCRTVWVSDDLDQDGKQEVLSTDYSNGGRVHVFELTAPNTLELVFSTPVRSGISSGSTPRWVRSGDLDGDGMGEFIFSLTNGTADGEVQVWEYAGGDNNYGTEPAIVMPADQFATALGIGNFRTNREVADVYDFDGDGFDELIMANRDNSVYVLGVVGQFPGFASWQVEGGDPANTAENRFSGGSWWHSTPADIDGDGTKEIVNHYWNFYGFWSIDPKGQDSYRYPTPTADARTDHYYEFLASEGADAVAYMGIYPGDVDGDGTEELMGVGYSYGYRITLVNQTSADTGVYVWDDSSKFGVIADGLWQLAGNSAGSHWGSFAADIDQDGKDELIIGGSAGYNVSMMKYKGTGSVLDSLSYDNSIIFAGADAQFFNVDIYDSLGISQDTVQYESPFVSKIYAGSDINSNNKLEVVTAYQSVADSITYSYYSWSVNDGDYIKDSTVKRASDKAVNIRVLEWQEASGLKEVGFNFVTPNDYVLEQNYPNPFNPSTTIRFSLPLDKSISLQVYDILGNEISTLINNEVVKKGAYEVTWNGRNNRGEEVASGTYIYTLKFGNFSKSAKMMLLR